MSYSSLLAIILLGEFLNFKETYTCRRQMKQIILTRFVQFCSLALYKPLEGFLLRLDHDPFPRAACHLHLGHPELGLADARRATSLQVQIQFTTLPSRYKYIPQHISQKVFTPHRNTTHNKQQKSSQHSVIQFTTHKNTVDNKQQNISQHKPIQFTTHINTIHHTKINFL